MFPLPQVLEVVAEREPEREEVLGLQVRGGGSAGAGEDREEDAAVTETIARVAQVHFLLADVSTR